MGGKGSGRKKKGDSSATGKYGHLGYGVGNVRYVLKNGKIGKRRKGT